MRDFVTEPIRTSEDGILRWKLDFGDDEAGVGTVELVDFPAGAFVEDDVAGFVDQVLKTERDEFLRRFDRQGNSISDREMPFVLPLMVIQACSPLIRTRTVRSGSRDR